MAKNAHMRQIEQMESEELLAQKKLRTEVIQLEDMLAQVVLVFMKFSDLCSNYKFELLTPIFQIVLGPERI